MWFRVWLYLFIMCIVFFKQKTAYEMRISDWSSDVCSSDLAAAEVDAHHIVPVVEAHPREGAVAGDAGIIHHDVDRSDLFGHPRAAVEAGQIGRASCREECVRTCRSRWSPYH